MEDILEAAHIVPHAVIGQKGNDASNGILLRADIHTLFDLNLIRITPDYLIETDANIRKALNISERLCEMRFPQNPAQHPSPEALAW
ncbi:HNH endonuclease signature motif containing protein [Novosphingobium sediminicola]|uniref:HNH endonuclease n=1 Tax=Novosphingobium sediminicola TaxID=563162 RepID=UPI0016186A48